MSLIISISLQMIATAFGDSNNDISMFKAAGHGIAMEMPVMN